MVIVIGSTATARQLIDAGIEQLPGAETVKLVPFEPAA